MKTYTQRLKERFFESEDHPYRHFERKIHELLNDGEAILDAGCGHSADVLRKYKDTATRLIGVDLVDFDKVAKSDSDIEVLTNNLAKIDVEDNSMNIIISRSVFEHLEDPLSVYKEFSRLLKSGGHAIVLTPNLGDYSAWISKAVPNKWHPWLVSKTEGRNERDTFPAFYRTNTVGAVNRLASKTGFELIELEYLGQYPCYFMFNPVLFLMATGYEKLISRFEMLKYLRGWLLFVLQKK